MDKVYEQQFRRSGAGCQNPAAEEAKDEEESSWGSSARPRSEGTKKRQGPAPREFPPLPCALRKLASGTSGRDSYELDHKLEVL